VSCCSSRNQQKTKKRSVLWLMRIWQPPLVLTDPLEVSSVPSTTSKTPALTDQAVIANAVGNSSTGANALAWANPSTGSAGVIEHIDAGKGASNGCKSFTTSRQSLEGATHFDGVACPSGDAWKLAPMVQ